jgi:hypothetical protein
MPMRSWVLKSWPEVSWELPPQETHWPPFQHMGTNVRADRDEAGRCVGETVWAARLHDDRVIGAAWEWVELLPGVPVIRDPNGFITNGCLLDAQGEVLPEPGMIVGLNRIARTIPWQGVVARVVGGEPMLEDFGLALARLAAGGPEAAGADGCVAPARRRSRAVARAVQVRSPAVLAL